MTAVAHQILLRVVGNALLAHLSRRRVICAVLACFHLFVSGYLGHLSKPESALILSSPMIDTNHRQRSHAVFHQEDES